MSLSERMEKENKLNLHSGVLLSGKKNNISKFTCKWKNKKNTLSEVTQTHKEHYNM